MGTRASAGENFYPVLGLARAGMPATTPNNHGQESGAWTLPLIGNLSHCLQEAG